MIQGTMALIHLSSERWQDEQGLEMNKPIM